MNRLLCAASILALTVPAIAAAQQQDDKHHGGQQASKPQNGGGQHAGRPGGGNAQPGQAQPNRQARPQAQVQAPSTPSHANRPGRPSGERPSIQPVPNQPGANRPGNNRPGNTRPGTRPTNFRPVRAAPFRYPQGYHYRRWNIGLILPSLFLTNYYFYNEWAAVGAYPPPPGFIWVRYGPDLLLVGRHSGRIRDVIYGAFY